VRTVLILRLQDCQLKGQCSASPAHFQLQSNERRIIQMVAGGVSPRDIARRLEIKEIEVNASLNSIFEKLATSGRLEMLSHRGPSR
jgi:DNA-binding CsgD family transcriptional regulator